MTKATEEEARDGQILAQLNSARQLMKAARGEERSERSRRIAISITELEKAIAHWLVWVMNEEQ